MEEEHRRSRGRNLRRLSKRRLSVSRGELKGADLEAMLFPYRLDVEGHGRH